MRRRSEEARSRLLATFRSEAEEHLLAINAALAALPGSPTVGGDTSAAQTLFRVVHTLKGAARSVGLLEAETVCQALEAVMSRITRGELALSPALVERVQETVDEVGRLVEGDPPRRPVAELVRTLESATRGGDEGGHEQEWKAAPAVSPTPSPLLAAGSDPTSITAPAGSPAGTPESGEASGQVGTIRVDAARLDALLLQMEDLLLPKLAAGQRVRELQLLSDRLAAHRREQAGEASAGLRPLESELREMVRSLRGDERRLARLHEELQAEVLRLRMSPASSIVEALPRMVRDLARDEGKEVDLTLAGVELELDRRVLERVKDPLIHLVRNAVDHGIECPEARVQAGKARRGRITVSFVPVENRRIEVSVRDDGAGVRLEEVRSAATRARVLTADAAGALEESAALDLLFHAGFSTSPIVTRVSGHGLGLSIVRESVEALGGELQIETDRGTGTAVRLRLPTEIATFRGLLVYSAGQPFLIPLEAAEHVLRLAPGEIGRVEGRPAIQRDGQLVPVAALHTLLELPPTEDPSPPHRFPCVVLRVGEDRLGLLVDEVAGERELLVKALEPPLLRLRHITGAGILGTGSLVLILRPGDLLRTALSTRPAPLIAANTPSRERAPLVLVVDDSITTRMMEKNLLESAGYTVKLAVDGMEAWTILKSEACDLVVSDVDMPRMDGFELTTRIRVDAALRDLPVILVTAMESREHRERGVLAGANAYVIKSSFEESNLLEIIQRLL